MNTYGNPTPVRSARAPIPGRPLPSRPAAAPANGGAAERAFAPLDGVTEAAGVEKLEGFSLKGLFSEVFRKHGETEVEEYFSGGYPSTTPPPAEISGNWPTPWVFTRLILASVAIFLVLDFGVCHFKNLNLLPGFLLVGSFAMPLATLVFFLEMNVWRNVSLYQIIRFFILGGVLSLIISLFFFDTTVSNWLESSMGASKAGIVEEIGKLLTLVVIAGRSKFNRTLNGLLLGAAIGAGFAAFESAGYAFRVLTMPMDSFDLATCRSVIILRGVLAPFGHVVWTAIAGAAVWRIKGDAAFRLPMLAKWKFWRLFAVPVLLHMLWNSSWNPPYCLKYIIIAIVDWAIVFALVQEGLREVGNCGARSVRAVTNATSAALPVGKTTFSAMVWAVVVFAVATFFTGFFLGAGGLFFSRVVAPLVGLGS